MKKKLILALVIAIGVVIVFAYGLKKWQNQKEANLVEMLTAENQLVYGNEIVELEKGEEIRSDVWNEFTETARMKGEKEENSEKRGILMHDIKIGMSYEEVKEKLDIIAKEIYRADGVNYTTAAEKAIKEIEAIGFDKIPVCVAKTQYSLSDDPTKLGCPKDFTITVRDVKLSAGAGFVVALTGDIMTMPGLPKVPAANKIDVSADGEISGLF